MNEELIMFIKERLINVDSTKLLGDGLESIWEDIKLVVALIQMAIIIWVKSTWFIPSLLMMAGVAILGVIRYKLTVDNRIKIRYTDNVYKVVGVVGGVILGIIGMVNYYPVLFRIFRESRVGETGSFLPFVYTMVFEVCFAFLWGFIMVGLCKTSSKISRWALRKYRKMIHRRVGKLPASVTIRR